MKKVIFIILFFMQKTALLLHWWWGNSLENWLPWLREKLESKAFEVFVPNLPNTDNPVIEEQLDYINNLLTDGFNHLLTPSKIP